MSELYLDEIAKLEHYRQLATEKYLKQGTLAGKEKIESVLSKIDTKLAIFKQSYIVSGETMDPGVFNKQKEDIYHDLSILYRILYDLANERVEKARIRARFLLDDLRIKARTFQSVIDTNAMTVYGKTIFHQANGFDQEYDNGQVIVHLGPVSVSSGSYLAFLFSCDEVRTDHIIFRLNGETDIPAYTQNHEYYKVLGNYTLHTEFHENTETSFGNRFIAVDTEICDTDQYNLFLNKDQFFIQRLTDGMFFYKNKLPETYYESAGSEEVSFYVYGASYIRFAMTGDIDYKNFAGDEILSPLQRQKIIIRGDRFWFDIQTDGLIFADKTEGIVADRALTLHREFEHITDYMVEQIAYGEDVVFETVDVVIQEAASTFYNIRYVAIKQIQISELEDRQ